MGLTREEVEVLRVGKELLASQVRQHLPVEVGEGRDAVEAHDRGGATSVQVRSLPPDYGAGPPGTSRR